MTKKVSSLNSVNFTKTEEATHISLGLIKDGCKMDRILKRLVLDLVRDLGYVMFQKIADQIV